MQHREICLLYIKLVADELLTKASPDALIVAPVHRSLAQWSNMIDMIGTIDPGGKFYLTQQQPEEDRCIRPLTITELLRMQGAYIREHFSNEEIARLVQGLPHRTMCKIIGQMYHLGVELAHLVAALLSTGRIGPRTDWDTATKDTRLFV